MFSIIEKIVVWILERAGVIVDNIGQLPEVDRASARQIRKIFRVHGSPLDFRAF